jgi:hypothetical protein
MPAPTPEEDRAEIWRAVAHVGSRITDLETTVGERKDVMVETIKAAVQEAMPTALLSDDEHRWVKLAIAREVQSIAFRRAVIEKTTLGLVWAGVVFIGLLIKEYAANHGWKP